MSSDRKITYRELIRHTRNRDLSSNEQLLNGALGLCGEAGEVADLIKKHMFQNHNLDIGKLKKELGDIRWYMELLFDEIGTTMEEIEQLNTEKLLKRYPNGFSTEASQNRVDTK